VSLAILLMAMAVCGTAVRNDLLAVQRSEEITRALMLTEDLLARLDTGTIPYEQDQSGDFDVAGLSYTLHIVPVEQEPELLRVTATVLQRDPSGDSGQDRAILVTDTLRAKPRPLNMKNDFGLDDEQLKLLTEAIPGGSQILDPENLDPTALARLDMDTLIQLLPIIMQALASAPGGAQAMQQMGQDGQGGLPPSFKPSGTGELQRKEPSGEEDNRAGGGVP
jgi:hypothetical protein